MTDLKAWALDISLISDYSPDAAEPVRLAFPSDLGLASGALVALMDRGRCCGLGLVDEHEPTLTVLPVSFEPNLLVSPLYDPMELKPEDRIKLFGHDEAHLCRILSSISAAPVAHPLAVEEQVAAPRYWKIAPGPSGVAWDEWRQRGIASIGWPALGDISQISEDEFRARAKAEYG